MYELNGAKGLEKVHDVSVAEPLKCGTFRASGITASPCLTYNIPSIACHTLRMTPFTRQVCPLGSVFGLVQ